MKQNVTDYQTLSSEEKVSLLENTVLHGSVDELKKVLETIPLSELEFTARAMGFACGYGSKEKVELLLDYGIDFSYEDSSLLRKKYQYLCRKYAKKSEFMLFLAYTGFQKQISFWYDDLNAYHFGSLKTYSLPSLLSNQERVHIALMLLERKCKGFDAEVLLYYAILWDNHELTAALKNAGITLFSPEDKEEKGTHFTYYETLTNTTNYIKRYEFCEILHSYSPEVVVTVLKEFDTQLRNLGDAYTPVIFNATIFEEEDTSFKSDVVLKYFVEYIDIRKMTKKYLMQLAVDVEAIGTLETIVRLGWLSKPSVRDKLIAYASKQQRIQSLTWLIQYKNITANLLEEEEKRLKREWAQLNAAPDSVMALKQLWSYKVLEDDTIVITKYKGEQEDVVIPAKIGKRAVTVIGKKAFCYDIDNKQDAKYVGIQNVRTVVIPKNIVKIEKCAFDACQSLTKVVMPDSVTTLEPFSFAHCCNLETITLSKNIKTIPKEAFSQCKKLKEITLPEQLTTIEQSAFLNCESLERLVIPETVSKICNSAFKQCTNLKSVEFLSPKIEIMYYAFADCPNLKTITVWGELVMMYRDVFINCKNVKDVIVKHKDCTAFWLGTFDEITIHAPANTFAMRLAKARNFKYVPLKLK